MAPARIWIEAARPRTLVAGVVPVVVGTAAAGRTIAWRALVALVAALALQVAVNYANDLFDARSGVDTRARRGPRRAVAEGLISERAMGRATIAAIAVAGVAGGALSLAAGPHLLLVGVACFAALLAYSGGRRPYASAGLGEISVFVFFGLVATVGSAYVQVEHVEARAVAASVPVGLLAAAILLANNVRDVDTDRAAGKRTLAVRLGAARSRALFRASVVGAFAGTVPVALSARSPWPLLALAGLPAAIGPLRLIGREDARGLVATLLSTARLELLFGVLLAAGLWVST